MAGILGSHRAHIPALPRKVESVKVMNFARSTATDCGHLRGRVIVDPGFKVDAATVHPVIVIGRRPIRGREGGYFAGRRVIAIDLRVIDIDVEIDEVEVSTLT